MSVQELSNLKLVKVKENWFEKSQNTVKKENKSEVEDFEDII